MIILLLVFLKFFRDMTIPPQKISSQILTFTNHHYDEKFINLALNLAYKNIGSTASNPIVACVIVKDNIILSSAITSPNGRPHAEINAINKIFDKKNLEGASLYVTLEPCCHIGKTLPCTDEIIKHKFSRVIICTTDPDPRVNGAGILALKQAGISVEVGIASSQAQEINRAFFKSRLQFNPFITIKIATSLDGKIATKNFQSKWISSDEARHFSHYLRTKNQAIMVGANTIIKDNPELNCRINGLEQYSPTKIIISHNLNFSFQENIFVKNLQFPTIILTSENNRNNHKLQEWLDLNANNQVIFCQSYNTKINLTHALLSLNKIGINSILIEGGQSLVTQFLQENLVDELIWIRSNKIIGNDGLSAIGNLDIQDLNASINSLKLRKIFNLAGDIIEVYN